MKRSSIRTFVKMSCFSFLTLFIVHNGLANDCMKYLSVGPKSGKILLSWSYVSGTDRVEILRGQAPNGPFITIAETQAFESRYLDVDVVPGIVYYYRVQRLSDKDVIRCVSDDIVGLAPGEPTLDDVYNQLSELTEDLLWISDNERIYLDEQAYVSDQVGELIQVLGMNISDNECPPEWLSYKGDLNDRIEGLTEILGFISDNEKYLEDEMAIVGNEIDKLIPVLGWINDNERVAEDGRPL